jgi:hypothetical protein
VAVVAEILDQNADFLRRCEVELITLKVQGVLVGPDQVPDEILVRWAVIQNFDVLRGLDENLGRASLTEGSKKKKESRKPAQDSLVNNRYRFSQVLQFSGRPSRLNP